MRPLEAWARYVDAVRRRDWDGVAAMVDEDVEITDHRPFGFGALRGRDAYLDYLHGMVALAPDTVPELTRVLHEDDSSFAAEIAVRGTGFEIVYAIVGEIRDDRLARASFYEAGDPRANVQPE